MKHKTIILTIFVGVIIVSGLFLYLISYSQNQFENFLGGMVTANTTNCDQIDVENMKDMCLFVSALVNRDLSACDMIVDDGIHKRCYALVTGNPRFCTEITEDETRINCYNESAENPINASICDYLSEKGFRDKCYYNLVIQNKSLDLSVCKNMTDTNFKDRCTNYIAVHTLNSSICMDIDDEERRRICTEHIKRKTRTKNS